MAITFLGLDGEMTSSELSEGGRLCQIGLSILKEGRYEVFSSDIGWSEYVSQPEALAVNGFTPERIEAGPSPEEVDEAALAWLTGMGLDLSRRGRIVPVGWNVGAFDMPFVFHALPRTAAVVGRRSLDLNAACFLLDGAVEINGSLPRWSGWKRLSKTYAEQTLTDQGLEAAWHDAGYDAAAALAAREFLRNAAATQ